MRFFKTKCTAYLFSSTFYDGICSLDHKFIQNDTLYSLEKDLRLNEFDRKYFESRNNTKEDDINVLAIACTRMCAFTFNKHYAGSLRKYNLGCICSSSNCSEVHLTNKSKYSTYTVSYTEVVKPFEERINYIDYTKGDGLEDYYKENEVSKIFNGRGDGSGYYSSPMPDPSDRVIIQ